MSRCDRRHRESVGFRKRSFSSYSNLDNIFFRKNARLKHTCISQLRIRTSVDLDLSSQITSYFSRFPGLQQRFIPVAFDKISTGMVYEKKKKWKFRINRQH